MVIDTACANHQQLRHLMSAPSGGSAVIPDLVFCLYQMMFAITAAAIVIGGAFERGKILPSLIFLFCWVTIVYCPIASWTWNASKSTQLHTSRS